MAKTDPLDTLSRVKRSHAQARLSYDRLSGWYDRIEGGWEGGPRRLGLEMLSIQPGERVLEIGCGTGAALGDHPAGIFAVGLDLSAGMLAQSQSRLKRLKLHQSAGLVQGDALHLPFANAAFDAAFMAFTLELMDTPEIPMVLAEIRRVLTPEGRLGAVALSKQGGLGWMQALYEWAHVRFPAAVDCRPIYLGRALQDAGLERQTYRLLTLTGLGVEAVVYNNAI